MPLLKTPRFLDFFFFWDANHRWYVCVLSWTRLLGLLGKKNTQHTQKKILRHGQNNISVGIFKCSERVFWIIWVGRMRIHVCARFRIWWTSQSPSPGIHLGVPFSGPRHPRRWMGFVFCRRNHRGPDPIQLSYSGSWAFLIRGVNSWAINLKTVFLEVSAASGNDLHVHIYIFKSFWELNCFKQDSWS